MRILRGLTHLLNRGVRRALFRPRVRIDKVGSLRRLGSDYGGWTFSDGPELSGAPIVSVGLGEDASVDVEFARVYDATVLLVDPTPRAVAHHAAMQARAGMPRESAYVAGGRQPASAYPFDGLRLQQLPLVEKALWTECTTLKFYMPINPDHVSHSLTNMQNAPEASAIEVESVTLADLMATSGLTTVPLLKLDIEGAEIDVLNHMLDGGIWPTQLLIEFDELMARTRATYARWRAMDRRLRSIGYACGYFDGRSCFLYVLKE